MNPAEPAPTTVPSPSPVKLQQQLVANMTTPTPMPSATPQGQITAGNIDLHNRPVVQNKDGSISTLRSIYFTDDKGHATVIPTVLRGPDGNGYIASNADAIAHFRKTGEHLGVFGDSKAAEVFAQSLHEAQAKEYVK